MIEVNWLAIVFAVVANMALGFLWYSPAVLGKQWMKEKGLSEEKLKKEQSQMGKWYMVSAVVALVQAFVLAHVMGLSQSFYNYAPVSTGLITAFWMWLGFVVVTQITATLFGGRNWKLFAIETGYQLVALLAMGLVIGMFS